MSTVRLDETPPPPRACSALGRLLMPARPPEVPDGADFFVPAPGRLHDKEVLRVSAFVALWSLVAVGCLLPWSGEGGWLMVLCHTSLCLLGWGPLWLLALLGCFMLAAALGGALESMRFITTSESLALIQAIMLLAFSMTACYLASSAGIVSQVVGWTWLFALGAEGLLRLLERGRDWLRDRQR